MRAGLEVLPGAAAVADVAAGRCVVTAGAAIQARGEFVVARSGGSHHAAELGEAAL